MLADRAVERAIGQRHFSAVPAEGSYVERLGFAWDLSQEVLVEAGITLMADADAVDHRSDIAKARQFRGGLMVALLAMCPIRLKNFYSLEIGRTFMRVNGSWWIVLPASETKERRADERAVPDFLTRWIDRYLDTHRQILARGGTDSASLWLSSNTGRPMTYLAVEGAISAATLVTIGTAISPHLFRTAAASTSAIRGGSTPTSPAHSCITAMPLLPRNTITVQAV